MKKRLVHFTSSLQQGGAETVLYQLLSHMSHTEYEHHVVFIHDGPFRQKIEQLGIPLYKLKGAFSPYDPLCLVRLITMLKKIKPHLISSSLWYANLLGRIAAQWLSIPFVCAAHALPEHEGRIRMMIDRYLPISPAHIIAVSPSIATSLQMKLNLPKHHIHTIPNSINLPTHNYRASKNKDIFIIGSVGRFVPVKNFDLLIHAFAELAFRYAHIELMLVGYGSEEKKLRSLAEKYKLSPRIHFIINKPSQNYYPFFDCFVQPSSYEGMSLALLEALSFKLPVIVTGHHYRHDIITHQQTGIVIEPNALAPLIAALEKYITGPDLREKYAHNGFMLVKYQYTIPTMIHRYSQLFDIISFTNRTV